MLAGTLGVERDKTFKNIIFRDFFCSEISSVQRFLLFRDFLWSDFFCSLWLLLLYLHGCLTVDTGCAAERGSHVSHSAALNVVLLPGLLPKEQGGDAGHQAAQEAAQDARLVQVLCVPVDQTWLAAGSAATY